MTLSILALLMLLNITLNPYFLNLFKWNLRDKLVIFWALNSTGHSMLMAISVTLIQQSFAENLIKSFQFESTSASIYASPYRSGFPVDAVPHVDMSSTDRDALCLQYQSVVGSLNWLAHTTHPDLSTIVSLLAQHQCNPSPGHLEAARYVVRYLATTKTLGIYITSYKRSILEPFLHFPLPQTNLLSMSDANWGPQDASSNKSRPTLPDLVSCSMSTFYIDLQLRRSRDLCYR
jgi:hypothetical protein